MRQWIDLVESLQPTKLIEDFTEGYCYALALELNSQSENRNHSARGNSTLKVLRCVVAFIGDNANQVSYKSHLK